MSRVVHIFRLSNVAKQVDAAHTAEARAAIAHALAVLRDNPSPDSFAGRKTQEPFPKEDDT